MMANKSEAEPLKGLLPLLGLGTAVIVGYSVLVRVFTSGRRVSGDGQYLVPVRGPWRSYDLRDFVQPNNPDVVAVYSRYGPDPWALFDFVCRNVSYRSDVGEFWFFPSETLRGNGDCEDSAILLTSLIRAGGAPNCYVALGSLGGVGHAWCAYDGQVLETTYTRARPVPDPQDYHLYCMFNESEVIELWPGAMDEVFSLRRNEEAKLSLMAKVLE